MFPYKSIYSTFYKQKGIRECPCAATQTMHTTSANAFENKVQSHIVSTECPSSASMLITASNTQEGAC